MYHYFDTRNRISQKNHSNLRITSSIFYLKRVQKPLRKKRFFSILLLALLKPFDFHHFVALINYFLL